MYTLKNVHLAESSLHSAHTHLIHISRFRISSARVHCIWFANLVKISKETNPTRQISGCGSLHHILNLVKLFAFSVSLPTLLASRYQGEAHIHQCEPSVMQIMKSWPSIRSTFVTKHNILHNYISTSQSTSTIGRPYQIAHSSYSKP